MFKCEIAPFVESIGGSSGLDDTNVLYTNAKLPILIITRLCTGEVSYVSMGGRLILPLERVMPTFRGVSLYAILVPTPASRKHIR